MQRSRMLTEFRNLVRATRLARANRMTLNDVLQQAAERQHRPTEPSRRRFVKDVGAIAGAGLLLNNLPAHAFGNRAPRIAIVGGGIGGLNAALTLQDAGLTSTIYEASGVVGGRIHSNAMAWEDNQTSEWCGEFIDSGHTCMQALARRFGLTLVDELEAVPPQSTDTLFFFEQYYGVKQAFRDFQVIADSLEDDANNLFPTTFDQATHFPRSVHLDHMSVYDWIERNVPGGRRSPLGLTSIRHTPMNLASTQTTRARSTSFTRWASSRNRRSSPSTENQTSDSTCSAATTRSPSLLPRRFPRRVSRPNGGWSPSRSNAMAHLDSPSSRPMAYAT